MRRGFSLIELLVVLSIIAMLSALVMLAQEEDDAHAVAKAARAFAETLAEARTNSLRSGRMHAFVCHIENVGDGSVLWNRHPDDSEDFPGRHWYAIVRDQRESYPPYAGDEYKLRNYEDADSFMQVVEEHLLDGRHYLPEGVRFLALSDTDRSASSGKGPANAPFPRPWHGWFDPTQERLFAWGGYNRDLGLGSGGQKADDIAFGYEGHVDGPIPFDKRLRTNVHPKDAGGYWVEACAEGRPRPLIDGLWMDHCLLFEPDGQVLFYPGGLRRVLFSDREDRCTGGFGYDTDSLAAITYTFAPDIDLEQELPNGDYLYDPDDLDPVTGLPRVDRFASAEDVLRTITPYVRVSISLRAGEVRVVRMADEAQPLRAGDLLK